MNRFLLAKLKPLLWFGAGAAVVGGIFLALGIANGSLFVSEGSEQASFSQRDFTAKHAGSSDNLDRTSPHYIEQSNNVQDFGQIGSDFSSLAAFYSEMAQTDETELLRLLNQTQELRAGRQREFVRTELLRRLAQTSPEQSLRRARQFPRMEQGPFVDGIFHEWSRINLQESVEAASQLPGSLRMTALQAILESRDDMDLSVRREISTRIAGPFQAINALTRQEIRKAADNPRLAWDMILNDELSDTRQLELLTWVAELWVEKDGIEAISEINASFFMDMSTRMNVVSAVLRAETLTNPQWAFDSALSMKGQLGEYVLSTVVQTWASFDPETVLAKVLAMDPSSQQRSLVHTVASSWASYAPQSMLEQLDLLPEFARENSLAVSLQTLGRSNPQQALGMLTRIKDRQMQLITASAVVSDWTGTDVDSALHWVLTDESIENFRYMLIADVLRVVASEDPQRAMSIALEQPAGEHQLGFENIVISHLAQVDIESAIRLLSQVPKESQDKAYTDIGYAFIHKHEGDRVIQLGLQLDGEAQYRYFIQIFGVWARIGPANLFRSLEKLPTTEIRSQAAMVLARDHQWQQVLSETELETVMSYLKEDEAEQLKQRMRDIEKQSQ